MSLPPLPASLPATRVTSGTVCWRVHKRQYAAIHFDRTARGRFNAPAGEFGVCYLGDSIEAAFIETLVRGSRYRLVRRADLAARFASRIECVSELSLIRLHSEGLARLALSADIPHRTPHEQCQALALAVHAHGDAVDGIEYRSRWDDSRLCVALFDRAAAKVSAKDRIRLDDLARVSRVLTHYDVGVI